MLGSTLESLSFTDWSRCNQRNGFTHICLFFSVKWWRNSAWSLLTGWPLCRLCGRTTSLLSLDPVVGILNDHFWFYSLLLHYMCYWIIHVPHATFSVCSGGFSQMYRCVCDWLGLPYKEEVQWVSIMFIISAHNSTDTFRLECWWLDLITLHKFLLITLQQYGNMTLIVSLGLSLSRGQWLLSGQLLACLTHHGLSVTDVFVSCVSSPGCGHHLLDAGHQGT